ncbi:MAG: hypothetical protein Ct9H300mP18_11500 [Candidatus Neomarinimicrobiota bacterium]|nr:MAG: hypothetical protein Ct9H300mP18_11500 [Candidatus Neomarinimicrobiota bacterium]
MIKIDQSLKGNEVVAAVSKSTEPNQDIAPKTEMKLFLLPNYLEKQKMMDQKNNNENSAKH